MFNEFLKSFIFSGFGGPICVGRLRPRGLRHRYEPLRRGWEEQEWREQHERQPLQDREPRSGGDAFDRGASETAQSSDLQIHPRDGKRSVIESRCRKDAICPTSNLQIMGWHETLHARNVLHRQIVDLDIMKHSILNETCKQDKWNNSDRSSVAYYLRWLDPARLLA